VQSEPNVGTSARVRLRAAAEALPQEAAA